MNRILIGGLASVLAGSLGLFPIAKHLHHVFASHDHIYSAKHHRIEDVPQADCLSCYKKAQADSNAESSNKQIATVRAGAPWHVEQFPQCIVSNLFFQGFKENPVFLPKLPMVAVGLGSVIEQGHLHKTLAVWPLAPKHSPPDCSAS